VTKLNAAIDFAKAELDTIRAKNRTYEQQKRAEVDLKIDTLRDSSAGEVAKLELQQATLERELEEMADTIELLGAPGADRYLELVRLQSANVDKILVVPADMPGLKLTA